MKNTFANAHLPEYHYSELDLIVALSERVYFPIPSCVQCMNYVN